MRGIIYCADPMFKEVATGDTTTTFARVMRAMIFAPTTEIVVVCPYSRAGILYEIAKRHEITPLFYFTEHSLDVAQAFSDDVNFFAFGEEYLPPGAFKQFYVRPDILWGKTNLIVRDHIAIAGSFTRSLFEETVAREYGIKKALQALIPRANIFEVKSIQ